MYIYIYINKGLGIFRELTTTRTRTSRVAFWDPPSGSKNCHTLEHTHAKTEMLLLSPGNQTEQAQSQKE